MLGGESVGETEGYALTLSKMEDSSISFHGTQLLTLSACSTAKGDVAKDGLEMDSLGMIAQQKDAEAVLSYKCFPRCHAGSARKKQRLGA